MVQICGHSPQQLIDDLPYYKIISQTVISRNSHWRKYTQVCSPQIAASLLIFEP
jgi:hypothetical protein